MLWEAVNLVEFEVYATALILYGPLVAAGILGLFAAPTRWTPRWLGLAMLIGVAVAGASFGLKGHEILDRLWVHRPFGAAYTVFEWSWAFCVGTSLWVMFIGTVASGRGTNRQQGWAGRAALVSVTVIYVGIAVELSVWISKDDDRRPVPDVVSTPHVIDDGPLVSASEDQEEARDILEYDGFSVEYASLAGYRYSGCEVTSQDPPAESEAVPEDTEVVLSIDCSQPQWEDETGSDWRVFLNQYSSGFQQGCRQLFILADGVLYDDFTISALDRALADKLDLPDCMGLDSSSRLDDVPEVVPEDPGEEGRRLGFLDGCNSLFESELESVLYDSDNNSFTALDCEQAAHE